MRTGIEPLHPYTRLEAMARSLMEQGSKSLPVVDAQDLMIGILTATDYLRSLEAGSFLQLLLRLIADQRIFTHRSNEIPVSEAITDPAVTVAADAGHREMVRTFHAHEGRSMPVVDAAGRLEGLLLRKEFVRVLICIQN